VHPLRLEELPVRQNEDVADPVLLRDARHRQSRDPRVSLGERTEAGKIGPNHALLVLHLHGEDEPSSSGSSARSWRGRARRLDPQRVDTSGPQAERRECGTLTMPMAVGSVALPQASLATAVTV